MVYKKYYMDVKNILHGWVENTTWEPPLLIAKKIVYENKVLENPKKLLDVHNTK